VAEEQKTIGGEKYILDRETRWTRIFRSVDNKKSSYHESKFQDGSASITIEELHSHWHEWSEREQLDFSNALGQLERNALPDILRFLMARGNQGVLSNVANLIPYALPSQEAVPFILKQCEKSQPGEGSNFFQALAKTDYDQRIPFLKAHLQLLVENPCCWESGTKYFNDIANQVVYRIANLLELGEPKEHFVGIYTRLKVHPHEFVRTITKNFLAKWFEASPSKTPAPE
jgi:hypothetical protein